MPTARIGTWLDTAIAKGLIPAAIAHPAPSAEVSEAQFQAKVIALARANGWRCYHTHCSKRSQPGWPDLAMVRPPVLILAELKTDTGATTPSQDEWLTLLRQVPGVRVRLWRPADWSEIVAELTASVDL